MSQRERFVRELEEKGKVINLEVDFCFKEGRVGTTLVSARPITIADEPGILSTTRDITERKHFEVSMGYEVVTCQDGERGLVEVALALGPAIPTFFLSP